MFKRKVKRKFGGERIAFSTNNAWTIEWLNINKNFKIIPNLTLSDAQKLTLNGL